jgi:hypothetical protein
MTPYGCYVETQRTARCFLVYNSTLKKEAQFLAEAEIPKTPHLIVTMKSFAEKLLLLKGDVLQNGIN